MEKQTYKGTSIKNLMELALVGAEFCTEKNTDGITVVNLMLKQLYIKTVFWGRLLKIIDIEENQVMSIEDFDRCAFDENCIDEGKERFKTDFALFKEMMNDAIENMLHINNDSMARLNDVVRTEITPEKIKELMGEKNKVLEQINEING